jgi:hypothetical protein
MNNMDILLKTPLSLLSIEEKLESKKLDARERRDFELQQCGRYQNRPFSTC